MATEWNWSAIRYPLHTIYEHVHRRIRKTNNRRVYRRNHRQNQTQTTQKMRVKKQCGKEVNIIAIESLLNQMSFRIQT